MDTDMEFSSGQTPLTPSRPGFDPTQPSTSNVIGNPGTPLAAQNQLYPQTMEYSNYGQNVATPPRTPIQANRVSQLREAATGRQAYTQNWMQDYSNSPVRSRPASVVGSTMSCMSEVSQYSLGGMSQLSINTEMANYPWPYAHNTQQAQNVLSTTSGTSSVENDHPQKPQKRSTLGDCLKALESNDLTKQLNALKELYPLATKGLATAVLAMGPKEYLKKLFYLLFRILRPQQCETELNEKVVDSTFIILYLSTKSKTCLQYMERLHVEIRDGRYQELTHPMGIFYVLLHRAGRIESKYVSKAWLVLSSLLCQSKLKRYITGSTVDRRYDITRRPVTVVEPDQALAFEVVQFLLMALGSDIESKSKGLAAAVLRVLIQSSQAAMVLAADRVKINGEMGAIEILLQIMVKDVIHENVLWASAQALYHFIHQHQYGERFVNLGGAQVLCGLLSHGSSRLLHELLRCLSQIADLPALGKQNMDESVLEVVKLLGANDPVMAELTTGFLMNIGQYNRRNKTILVNCGTTDLVFSVLRLTDEFLHRLANTAESDNIRKRVGNIYENCLCILNNLTKMSSDDILETAKEACMKIYANKSSAPALLNFIGIGYRFCRRLSISILKRVIDTIPAYALQFFEIHDTKGEQLPLILLKRVWQSFEKYQKHNYRIMNGEAKPKSESQRRDHEEIACRTTKLLADLFLLKVENNKFRKIILDTVSTIANPLQFLERQVSDKMVYDWLSFVWTVTTSEDCMQSRLLFKLVKASPVGLQRLNQYHMHSLVPGIKEVVTKILQLAQQQQQQQQQPVE